jgi:hypothetical protein
MTKLEAWKAWCDTTGTGDRLANQFTLDNSSHGKAFSFAWDAATEMCAKVCEEPGWNAANWCAKQIRARGEKT